MIFFNQPHLYLDGDSGSLFMAASFLDFRDVIRTILNGEHTEIDKKSNYLCGMRTITLEFNFQYGKLCWFPVANEKAFIAQSKMISKEIGNKLKELTKQRDQIEISCEPETALNFVNKSTNGRCKRLHIKFTKAGEQNGADEVFDLIVKTLKTLSFYDLIDKEHIKKVLEKYVRKYNGKLSEEAKQKKVMQGMKTILEPVIVNKPRVAS